MGNSPFVSVLVTPYNQQAYIRQTLDSILMQECDFDFEIVLGEDCSTDGTREICMEYAAKHPDRIVLCLNESNKGLLNNYFDVFLKAKGKYIADCGGDDYWLTTNKLQKQVDLLEAHPEVSMVTGNWQLFHQKTGTFSRSKSWLVEDRFQSEEYGLKAIANYLNDDQIPRMVLAASCFRGDWARELYGKHPELFRSEHIVCEDLPLTLGLLLRGPFYFCSDTWLVYRVLEKSLSHSERHDDYVKGFAFAAYRQTLELAKTLGLEISRMRPYTLSKAGDFALHALLNGDAAFYRKTMDLLHSYGLTPRMKHRLYGLCLKFPVLSMLARTLYRKPSHAS